MWGWRIACEDLDALNYPLINWFCVRVNRLLGQRKGGYSSNTSDLIGLFKIFMWMWNAEDVFVYFLLSFKRNALWEGPATKRVPFINHSVHLAVSLSAKKDHLPLLYSVRGRAVIQYLACVFLVTKPFLQFKFLPVAFYCDLWSGRALPTLKSVF